MRSEKDEPSGESWVKAPRFDLEPGVRERGQAERRSRTHRREAVLRAYRVDALDEVERDPGVVLGALRRRGGTCRADGRDDGEKYGGASLH